MFSRGRRILALAAAVLLPVLPHLRGVVDAQSGTIRFENVARASGIAFRPVSGDAGKKFLPESTGGGVALFDFDRDGWLDLYFVNGSTLADERAGKRRAPNRLFRNNGNATFSDVTVRAGVAGQYWGMGVCAGDVNGDGFEDLYVTNLGPNILYINNGDGTFRDSSRESGTDDASYSSSCGFADYDADGDLDLYVSNYVEFDVRRPPERTNDGSRCGYRGLEVACGPRGLTPMADRFFENLGNGRFRDETMASGLGRVAPSYGMGLAWADYDEDGDQDLYVANDEMPNFLFRNNGNRTFTEVGLAAGVALGGNGSAQGSMGVDFGDIDNDADLDLIVTNFDGEPDMLYVNEGNGAFTDGTPSSGILAPSLAPVGWGAVFADFDLDGLLDLAVAYGHLYPQLESVEGLPLTQGQGYRQRNFLFRNAGNRRFTEVGERAGAGFRSADRTVSRGVASGDLNNDGLVDLVITSLDDPPFVLLNRSAKQHWLTVTLAGTVSNRSAIGARVTVRTGTRVQRRDVKSGASYQSQSDRRLHFGLGAAIGVDELIVRWPSGRTETRRNVPADAPLVITER